MNSSAVDVVIMAAGQGTRMKSALPKVLHRVGGRALVEHVVYTATQLQARHVVVITGHGAEQVEAFLHTLSQPALQFARQMPQRGTGHAVQQALPHLPETGTTLILSGDVPLISAATLQRLLQAAAPNHMALLTLTVADASGYGRILRRADGSVAGIVEHKDATPEQREIREFYTGIMAVPNALLKPWLGQLNNNNAQGEYYLTDIVAMAVKQGVKVVTAQPQHAYEVAGVNSPAQLAELERAYQLAQAQQLMAQGVRLADPARFDLRGQLHCGQDVEIDINCIFSGRVQLGQGVRIGAHCVISDAVIEDGAVIHPYTHMDGGVRVGPGSLVGPYARLRAGADLSEQVHIGNFVEVKNSTLAAGAKANHLAYLGDAQVGERVNYGAGAITANYDGANKHSTTIEADVHVGSNAVLVAPVTLGAGATVGAGSTITKDVAAGSLSVARGKQVNVAAWERPRKAKIVQS